MSDCPTPDPDEPAERAELAAILAHAGVGIAFTRDRIVQRCNEHFVQTFGYGGAHEVIGRSSLDFYLSADDYEAVGRAAYPELIAGRSYRTRLRMRRRDGSAFWVQMSGSLIAPDDPERGSIWIFDDVDAAWHTEQALTAALADQQLILDHAMVGIVFLNERRVTRCNRRFEEMFGYEPGELLGQSSRRWYLNDEDWRAGGERCYEPFRRGEPFQGEMLLGRKDGTPLWCEVRAKAIDPQDIDHGSIWVTMDISERKRVQQALEQARAGLEQTVQQRTEELRRTVGELEQALAARARAESHVRYMAEHDALTGLANRRLFEQRLSAALRAAAAQPGRQGAVLLIDLDRFKNINDALGHDQGDLLLREVGQRITHLARPADTVARLGGDEFVVVRADGGADAAADARVLAERIRHALAQPVRLGPRELRVAASIGITVFPADGRDVAELLKQADMAMYQAKHLGRDRACAFDAALAREYRRRLEVEEALPLALQRGEFELHYQPQLDTASGAVIGAEALLRWRRDGRLVPPVEFIPIAEDSGFIRPLGAWVLDEACRQAQAWLPERGTRRWSMAVNVSAVQLQHGDFGAQVLGSIARSGLPPEHLELELTETAVMTQIERNVETLALLNEQGVRLAVDDFGTGYSSLAYLRRLPLSRLKIDRSFVADIATDADDATICRTIASMARNLNLAVTAEGVETAEQLALLRDWGCDAWQGYLFSRPVPAAQFARFVGG
jgi:diguanylate cyclase (GGDEF)-like protein/PAS domain S-box-containing protein